MADNKLRIVLVNFPPHVLGPLEHLLQQHKAIVGEYPFDEAEPEHRFDDFILPRFEAADIVFAWSLDPAALRKLVWEVRKYHECRKVVQVVASMNTIECQAIMKAEGWHYCSIGNIELLAAIAAYSQSQAGSRAIYYAKDLR